MGKFRNSQEFLILMENSEETSVHPACPTTGQVLCFSPKLFGFLHFCFVCLGFFDII